ncbi:MAG: NADH-quinone oxidoreductase subunit J [Phycisphaerales bacterium JB063]
MSTPLLLYIASVLGAIAMVLMMPRPGGRLAPLGALLGAATLGGCWLAIAFNTGLIHDFSANTLGLPATTFVYFYIFSAIAIAAAVRVITHRRPVYAALWFIMVVLASGGMFLVLSADFMAFAMIIIYGGAILVTYMFVIMLASQPLEPGQEDQAPSYDRFANDPLWACVAGFLLLAVLLTVSFDSPGRQTLAANPDAAMASDGQVLRETLTGRGLDEENNELLASSPQYTAGTVSNVERVGLDLFNKHPLAIELAGVILLVSLIGAVVIAKTQVPPGAVDPDATEASVLAARQEGGTA